MTKGESCRAAVCRATPNLRDVAWPWFLHGISECGMLRLFVWVWVESRRTRRHSITHRCCQVLLNTGRDPAMLRCAGTIGEVQGPRYPNAGTLLKWVRWPGQATHWGVVVTSFIVQSICLWPGPPCLTHISLSSFATWKSLTDFDVFFSMAAETGPCQG